MLIACFIFLYLLKIPSFLVLRSWQKYAHSHPNRSSKRTHNSLTKRLYFDKKCTLNLNFHEKGNMYADFLNFILTFYRTQGRIQLPQLRGDLI